MNPNAPPARLSLAPSVVVLNLLLITLLLGVAPPLSRAATDEEHPPHATSWQAGDPVRLDELSAGELMWTSDQGLIALPVIETKVLLEVHGVMLSGRLTQRFRNPSEEVIEVTYLFPLPERAAVSRMELVIGTRRIISRVEERAEARRSYEKARADGHKAALASQQRPNLFTVRAANINPGEEIDVELSFVQEVELRDGLYGLRFPMTFTPRFSSPRRRPDDVAEDRELPDDREDWRERMSADCERPDDREDWRERMSADCERPDDQEGWRERVSADCGLPDDQEGWRERVSADCGLPDDQEGWGERVSADCQRPDDQEGWGERVSADCGLPDDQAGASFVSPRNPSFPVVSLEARLDAGLELEAVSSASHEISIHWEGETWVITPKDDTLIADRDFLLSWKPLNGAAARASFLTERREDGLYGLLMVIPPRDDSPAASGMSTETVFVVDISGSMQGSSIRQAREALSAALSRLRPDDSFNIIVFNDEQKIYSRTFLPATDGEIRAATDWAGRLEADGGTEILPALRLALRLSRGEEHAAARRIIFLTDGAVSDERAVFDLVASQLGDVRLHTIGIGSAPNTWLMRKMADFGRGRSTFIGNLGSADNEIDAFLASIDRPVMRDLQVEFVGDAPLETWPARLPDLYPGDPLVASFLFAPGSSPQRAILHGRLAGNDLRLDLAIAELNSSPDTSPGLATRWARGKVASLLDSLHEDADAQTVRASVIDLGRRFHLITPYTSLVAVELFPSAFEDQRSLRVPNALPAGMPMLMLPRSGTLGPLLILVGLLLVGSGGLLLLLPACFTAHTPSPPPSTIRHTPPEFGEFGASYRSRESGASYRSRTLSSVPATDRLSSVPATDRLSWKTPRVR